MSTAGVRLRAQSSRDPRAALIQSLDSGLPGGKHPDLAEYGLALSRWSASAPGRALFSSEGGTGLHLAVVAKDLTLANDARAAQLRRDAPGEAEAYAARVEAELLAAGKPCVAVGSACCLEPGQLQWGFCHFPAAGSTGAGTPEMSLSAVRRACTRLDAAFQPQRSPFAFPSLSPSPGPACGPEERASPAPTVAGGEGLPTPTFTWRTAGGAVRKCEVVACDGASITKSLESVLGAAACSTADSWEDDQGATALFVEGPLPACKALSTRVSGDAVVALQLGSETTTAGSEECEGAEDDAPTTGAGAGKCPSSWAFNLAARCDAGPSVLASTHLSLASASVPPLSSGASAGVEAGFGSPIARTSQSSQAPAQRAAPTAWAVPGAETSADDAGMTPPRAGVAAGAAGMLTAWSLGALTGVAAGLLLACKLWQR